MASHFGLAASVAAHPSREGVWASCGADRQLLVCSASATMPMQRLLLPSPAHCVAYSADGALLATGHDDGAIVVLRAGGGGGGGGGPLPAQASGGSGAVEVISFAPSSSAAGGLVACGCHDRMVRVLELRQEARPGSAGGFATGAAPRLQLVPRFVCSGHTATATHLDWSADGSILMSNCAAHEILVWNVADKGQRLAQPGRALATAQWASWTCYLGFPCMGIWPDGSDSTDVNSCHLSSDKALLLVSGAGLAPPPLPCVPCHRR